MDEWRDISVPVAPGRTPLWPGTPPIRFDPHLAMERGDAADDTLLSMSVHAGTHIDAPAHFIPGGRRVEELDLETLVGPCRVADLGGRDQISASDLRIADIPEGTRRLLLKTDNHRRWGPDFDEEYTALLPDAAEWVVEQGIRLVGIDYLSIQAFEAPDSVHTGLLSAGVVVLEGLDLREVDPGPWELLCLPIKLVGTEAAPVRALLRRTE
ncbi:MAG: cyclase family protein [bacterium]